ncbi:MAG: hypothetical protein K5678_05255 [Acetatifactor sp.]|nr:hypothetical protein [Acetatifactor sp.]
MGYRNGKIDEKLFQEYLGLQRELFAVKEELAKKNGKDIYAFSPCFVGKNYFDIEPSKRVMIFGQNSNGWDRDDGKFHNAKEYADYIVEEYWNDGFGWIWQEPSGTMCAGNKQKPYHINRSAFWRAAKLVWQDVSGEKIGKKDKWVDNIAQSETMRISYHDNSKGNVSDKDEIAKQKEISLKLLKKELQILKPEIAIFYTNDDANTYFHEELKKELSQVYDDLKLVKRCGLIGDTKCIVTYHPQYILRQFGVKDVAILEECKTAYERI